MVCTGFKLLMGMTCSLETIDVLICILEAICLVEDISLFRTKRPYLYKEVAMGRVV